MPCAAVVKELIAAGLEGDALIAALERIDAANAADALTARQLRNRRYYENKRLKASEKRLNADEPKASESVLKRLNSDASRVRDNPLTLVSSGKNPSEAKASSGISRATKRCPADFEPDETVWRVALEHGFDRPDAERQLAAMRDYEFRNAHKDWQAVARNWLRKADPRRRSGGQQQLSFAVQDAMLAEAESQSLQRYIEEKYGSASTSDSDGNFGFVVALPSPKAYSG